MNDLFGAYSRSGKQGTLDNIQHKLINWAMYKYKHFRSHHRRAEEWLNGVKKREPKLLSYGLSVDNGIVSDKERVNRELHLRFCERPCRISPAGYSGGRLPKLMAATAHFHGMIRGVSGLPI